MATHPTYRDVYVDQGSDYNEIIELSVNYADYYFYGEIKRNVASQTAAAQFAFDSVLNEPKKMHVILTGAQTDLLKLPRALYDIYARNKSTNITHKEREGQVFIGPRITTLPTIEE
jgi:hypothetical protein